MRRRKIGYLVGLLVIAGAVAYVAQPTGHIPLYDANLVRLAESDLQGYCAGDTLLKTAGRGSGHLARECRSRLAGKRSDEPDAGAVPRAFCQALVDFGWEGTVDQCEGILRDNELWPTFDGGLSDQWNRARQYPLPPISGGGKVQQESRTGSHQGQHREDDSRGDRGYTGGK